MRYQHVLFDLDRTLWDFQANSYQTFREMFDFFCLGELCKTTFDSFYAEYNKINSALWDLYRKGILQKEILYVKRFSLTLEHYGIVGTEDLSRKLGDFYVLDGPKKNTLIEGAVELLEDLSRKKYSMYIVSNGFKEVQFTKLKTSHIDIYFKNIYLSELIGYQKPDRRIFDAILLDIGTTPETCIMIGDDLSVDIEGAKNAGIDQIFCNFSHIKTDINPTYEVQKLCQISSIL